jgi:hypothetical protein
MKKWFVLAMIVAVAGMAQAGEDAKKKGEGKGQGKDVTKKQYVAQQKKMAEKKGTEFDKAKAEAQFDKKDKNNDGVLTADEKGKKKGKGKGKKEEK